MVFNARKPGVPGGASPLGWKPAFPTPSYSELIGTFLIEKHSNEVEPATERDSQVGKVGLPPLIDAPL